MKTHLSTTELAARWGMSRQMILLHIKAGHIPADKVGVQYMIPVATLPRQNSWPKKKTGPKPKNSNKEEGR